MEKVNNKGKVFLIVIFIILILSGFILLNLKQTKTESDKIVDNRKYILLSDYSRFFTINSCVYKFVQYLQTEDMESIFLVFRGFHSELPNIYRNQAILV